MCVEVTELGLLHGHVVCVWVTYPLLPVSELLKLQGYCMVKVGSESGQHMSGPNWQCLPSVSTWPPPQQKYWNQIFCLQWWQLCWDICPHRESKLISPEERLVQTAWSCWELWTFTCQLHFVCLLTKFGDELGCVKSGKERGEACSWESCNERGLGPTRLINPPLIPNRLAPIYSLKRLQWGSFLESWKSSFDSKARLAKAL